MNDALSYISLMQVYGISFLEDLASWLLTSPVAFIFCVFLFLWIVFDLFRMVIS